MKSRIPILYVMVLIGTIALLSVSNLEKYQVQAQQIELACPSGTNPLFVLTTRNPNTGGIRQYGCVDSSGNLSVSNAVGPVVLLNPTSSQTITNASASTFIVKQAIGTNATIFRVTDGNNNTLFDIANTSTDFTITLGAFGSRIQGGTANDDFQGKLTCSGGTITKTFALAFSSTPTVIIFDETTKGGVNLTAISNTAFTASCTGATDALDYIIIGNPN